MFLDKTRQMLIHFKQMDAVALFDHRKVLWDQIQSHIISFGINGLTLKDESSERWCIITPDTISPARYTLFDSKGLFGHSCYNSFQEALKDVFSMGYRVIVPVETFDQISKQWEPETVH